MANPHQFLKPTALFFFFFNDTATTEIYTSVNTLSLHDALPSCAEAVQRRDPGVVAADGERVSDRGVARVRGGGRRSEEHTSELQSLTDISYAVFCLKKKKKKIKTKTSTIKKKKKTP